MKSLVIYCDQLPEELVSESSSSSSDGGAQVLTPEAQEQVRSALEGIGIRNVEFQSPEHFAQTWTPERSTQTA